jgi:hypothetical protein
MYHIFRIHPFLRFFTAIILALAGFRVLGAVHSLGWLLVALALLATSAYIMLGLARRGRAYLDTYHG